MTLNKPISTVATCSTVLGSSHVIKIPPWTFLHLVVCQLDSSSLTGVHVESAAMST